MSDLVKIPEDLKLDYESARQQTNGIQIRHLIERIAQHDAEIERLRKALRNMVIMTGKPHREEWLNPQAFADALKIFEEAREALERTDQQLQPRENRDEIWRNS
jgi:hypothetical protein